MAAAAIAGRTKTAGISISALLAPLHDPVRIAEDLAVLDLLSDGSGHDHPRPGLPARGVRDVRRRRGTTAGAFFDEWVQALLDAWSGEPFTYRDRKVPAVTPPALTDPHPPDLHRWPVQGRGPPGRPVRAQLLPRLVGPRAAGGLRGGLPDAGHEPGFMITPEDPVDLRLRPRRPRRLLGAHRPPRPARGHDLLGLAAGGRDLLGRHRRPSIEELKAGDRFAVLTPDEAVAHLRRGNLLLYPLCGGIPPELAWESLHLVEHEVLPEARRATE